MPSPSYIPARDADFLAWLLNFGAVLDAAPASYGVSAAEAQEAVNQGQDFSAAYAAATNPGTRTSATVAAKDSARVAAESVCRPLAQRVKANPLVSNDQRRAVGVTVDVFPPTPIPPPQSSPSLILSSAGVNVHNLQYRDSVDPTSKAKPFGVKQLTLFRTIGVAAAVDPEAARYVGGYTKTPLQVQTTAADRGKVATYFARWETGSGAGGVASVGPWGEPLAIICL